MNRNRFIIRGRRREQAGAPGFFAGFQLLTSAATSCIAVALLPLILCSCGTLSDWTAPNRKVHQSPKEQAAQPQAPKTQPESVPQQTPRTNDNAAEQQTPKAQPTVVPQQTPKVQAAEQRPAPAPQISSETLRKILLGVDLAFSRACEERGAPEAFYDFMAADGVCLLTGEQPVQGRDAIKVRFAAVPTESISWKPREAEIGSDSNQGYTWGMYQLRTATGDKQNSASGKYVAVWKKQPDGEWKAAVFITSAGPVQRNEE